MTADRDVAGVTAIPVSLSGARTAGVRRWLLWAVPVVGALVLQLVFAGAETFPASLDALIADPIDDAGAWMRSNRLTHPLFIGFFTPISSAVGGIISGITEALLWTPWYVVIGLAALAPLSRRMWAEVVVVAASLAYIGLFDLWVPGMETLALMATAVLLAVAIGLPLGVWAALNSRVEQTIRPVLDAMQTIPAFIYFRCSCCSGSATCQPRRPP